MKVCIVIKCNNIDLIKHDMDKNINDLLEVQKFCIYDYLKRSTGNVDDTIFILQAIQRQLPSQY